MIEPVHLAVLVKPAIILVFFGFVWLCHRAAKKLPQSQLRNVLLKPRGTKDGWILDLFRKKQRRSNSGDIPRQ